MKQSGVQKSTTDASRSCATPLPSYTNDVLVRVHSLEHSPVRDLHCRDYGRSGGQGARLFVNPDGSLRVTVQPWRDGPFLTHGRFTNRPYALWGAMVLVWYPSRRPGNRPNALGRDPVESSHGSQQL